MDRVMAHRWWIVALTAVAGVVIGVVISLTGSTDRRAEASVLVSSPRGTAAVTPLLPNLRELATSSVLAGNVHSTLRLKESVEDLRRRLHAEARPRSQVIVISASDANADKARQVVQEAAVVFTQLVGARFGTATPPLQAAVLDSAHVLSASNRHFVRNALIGALVGALVGGLAAFVIGGGVGGVAAGVSAAAVRDLGRRESLVEQRVKAVTKRERELADRAGYLAARERELTTSVDEHAPRERGLAERETRLDARERELAERVSRLTDRERKLADRAGQLAVREREVAARSTELAEQERELEARPEPPPPPPEAVPAVLPDHRPEFATSGPGRLNVQDLQHAVDARTGASPEQAEEWRTYLFFLREHAAADGSLPTRFGGLVDDIFGDLLP